MTFDNLASGLLGAIVGLVGAFLLQRADASRQGRGATRAVHHELLMNLGEIEAWLHGLGTRHPLRHDLYDRLLPEVAAWLSPSDLDAVALTYVRLEAFGPISSMTPVSEESREFARKIAKRGKATTDLLFRRAYWWWERARAIEDQKEIARQLAAGEW